MPSQMMELCTGKTEEKKRLQKKKKVNALLDQIEPAMERYSVSEQSYSVRNVLLLSHLTRSDLSRLLSIP